MPIVSVRDLLADVQLRPVWDGASISPADAEYPRVHVDWHKDNGFVFQCYENEESWSDFLVTSREFSTPTVPALEWVRIDGFPRVTLWEGREQREVWERDHLRKP